MPRIPLYYSILNINGEIVFSQITQDPNYPVGEGQRLVKDQIPDYDALTQYIDRIEPVPSGQDFVEYQIKEIVYTDIQLQEMAINRRNEELLQSDWTQLPDVSLTIQQVEAWRIYRQELRDITIQPGYPKTINWPVKPE